jgi:hypothetical protein
LALDERHFSPLEEIAARQEELAARWLGYQ